MVIKPGIVTICSVGKFQVLPEESNQYLHKVCH